MIGSRAGDPNGPLHVTGLGVGTPTKVANGSVPWPTTAALHRAQRLVPLPLPPPRKTPDCQATHGIDEIDITLSDATIHDYLNCRTPASFAPVIEALKPVTGWAR